jgi:hypothetical protein
VIIISLILDDQIINNNFFGHLDTIIFPFFFITPDLWFHLWGKPKPQSKQFQFIFLEPKLKGFS